MATARSSTGARITFSSSFFTGTLREIRHVGFERPALDVSELEQVSTGSVYGRKKIPETLYDPGRIEVEGIMDSVMNPPMGLGGGTGAAAETITLTHPNGSDTWSASGFLTSFETTYRLGEPGMFSASLELSGNLTT